MKYLGYILAAFSYSGFMFHSGMIYKEHSLAMQLQRGDNFSIVMEPFDYFGLLKFEIVTFPRKSQ